MARHAQDGTNPNSKTVEQIEKERAHERRVDAIHAATPMPPRLRRQIRAAQTGSLVVPR